MKRPLPFSTQHGLTRDGKVWCGTRQLPASHCEGRYGMQHLVIWIDDTRYHVWKLLSAIWYDNQLILPRDGNLLNWKAENVLVFSKATRTTITENLDPEVVFRIWSLYQMGGVPCWDMGDKSGLLGYSIEEYKTLIKDILVASVR